VQQPQQFCRATASPFVEIEIANFCLRSTFTQAGQRRRYGRRSYCGKSANRYGTQMSAKQQLDDQFIFTFKQLSPEPLSRAFSLGFSSAPIDSGIHSCGYCCGVHNIKYVREKVSYAVHKLPLR
jgi:hypothetical protein